MLLVERSSDVSCGLNQSDFDGGLRPLPDDFPTSGRDETRSSFTHIENITFPYQLHVSSGSPVRL